jgi:putative transcriptional regulator
MISHHPSDATLIASAAGSLPRLHGHVLAVHMANCATCQGTVRLGEEMGGVLLESVRPESVGEDALAKTLARLDEPAPENATAASALPTTLDALTQHGRWRPVGFGIRLMPLAPRDSTATRLDLIRVTPGTALPRHEHTGDELTCVLQGAYTDETGEYRAGDVAEGGIGLDHRPKALPGAECICLISTTGFLRSHSLIGRMLQPFFGI